MSINRIQKLLFSEYCDFEDMVLVESPFAQTSREGKGIRQVHLGLTPSKLILATDIIPSALESSVTYIPGIDPYIETFELVAVYPVECVNLSVFHRRKRQSLKAHFCNNNVLYFELGGFEKRNMFWNLWCERVQFLNPEDPGSSYTETSVASSTTNSTIYLISSKKAKNLKGKPQIWCNFGAGDATMNEQNKWTEKYLLYDKNEDSALNYKPIIEHPSTCEFVRRNRCKFSLSPSQTTSCSEYRSRGSRQLNRFGRGIKENCSTCLFLPAENCIVSKRFSEMTTQSADLFTLYPVLRKDDDRCNFEETIESSVKLWELYKDVTSTDLHVKHRRRYAFLPLSHFLNGLGPWNVSPGERYSVQVKRVVSAVNIRRQPNEPELRLPVSKRQLVASISCETLHLDGRLNTRANSLNTAPSRPVIFFWTPEYWYRPRTAKDAYNELQNHLSKIREYHHVHESKSKKCKKINSTSREIMIAPYRIY